MILIYICAIYGISTFVKDMDGPFDVMLKIRLFLFNIPTFNVFFYKLLSCYFCVGAYSGMIVYLLSNHFKIFNVYDFILWIFFGSVISMFGNLITNKLLGNNND